DPPYRQRAAVLEHAPDSQRQHGRLSLRRGHCGHGLHRTFSDPYAGWKPVFEALTSSLPFFFGRTLKVTMPSLFVFRTTARMPTPVPSPLAPASRLPCAFMTETRTELIFLWRARPETETRSRGCSLICCTCDQSPWLRSSSTAATRQ